MDKNRGHVPLPAYRTRPEKHRIPAPLSVGSAPAGPGSGVSDRLGDAQVDPGVAAKHLPLADRLVLGRGTARGSGTLQTEMPGAQHYLHFTVQTRGCLWISVRASLFEPFACPRNRVAPKSRSQGNNDQPKIIIAKPFCH